jgi:hypothetical protein
VIKASIDASAVTRSYGQALRRLAQLSGFNQRSVLLGEAGVILKTCAGRTKVATQAHADKQSRLHATRRAGLTDAEKPGEISINAGIKAPVGRIWRRVGKARKFLLIGQLRGDGRSLTWRAPRWGTYDSVIQPTVNLIDRIPPTIAKGRRAIGLARQSWLQVADALGIDLNAVQGGGTLSAAGIAKARTALATTGKTYVNGTGSVLGDSEKTVVNLINRLPYGIPAKLDRVLLGVLSGRAKFFARNYAKGAFDSMTTAARAYPWLRVRPPAGAN